MLYELNLFVSFCMKKHKLHLLIELLMEISGQTDISFLLKIFNISMREREVRSFAHPLVFMVGFIKTILERISHLWTCVVQVSV